MGHHCHAINCDTNVLPRMHMCGKHWAMVPRRKQADLWANYRRGQESDKQPSAKYLRAAAACVRSVAEQEGVAEDVIASDLCFYLALADIADKRDG